MSEAHKPVDRLGLLVIAMFLVTFAFGIYSVTSMDIWDTPDLTPQQQRTIKYYERAGESEGPDYTTMDAQLVIALEKKQVITQIRLEGTPTPLDGMWTVKEVGYDLVVLEGSSGLMSVRMEAIVSIQVRSEEPKKTAEPQVEK